MKKIKPGNIIMQILLIVFAAMQLFPLYWMITFSLKGNMEIFGGNVLGLPQNWRFDNYTKVVEETRLARYFFNSIVVTGLTIFFTLLFSAMITYGIVRLKWKLSKAVYTLFLVGMMIPIHAVLLPLFLNLDPVLNSYISLVLPYTAFAMPLGILIMVGVLEGLPKELEEAAFIDGASIYKIFFHIILPLLTPALSTVAILTFLSSWNELMLAVTFVSDSRFKTITTGVMELIGKYSTQWGPVGAGLVIATIPTLILYMALSENVQKSLAAGAVKG
ncbi:L-arabinose transport system permease protein AraQ [Lachnospiraceae bacterium]|nr:carbohydrate ABC transporter permease [Lachnospiraceae bacterium]MCI9107448.1 carbohydrate ABC transporter permease [Lachnospiraceae bacterium]GFH93180.1 L-arabinose transport system permease protein AraQ [Lachnospiraceae bacterium]